MSNALLIFGTTFFAILKIILTAFGGYVLAKKGIFHKQLTKDMGKVIFTFMVPCMIFGNIIENVNTDKIELVGILFLFPILTHLLAFSLGNILSKILRFQSEEEEHLLVVAGSTFGNHGNIAVPLFAAILSDPRGPFASMPNAQNDGAAYVMIYMSMSSVIIWAVGMPWFKRRNQQKILREKEKEIELEKKEKETEPEEQQTAEKRHETHHDLMKVSLLQQEEGEGGGREGGEENAEDTNLHRAQYAQGLKRKVENSIAAIRKTYIYEILTLPPVLALTSALIISFIPPLRKVLLTTYAQVITNTATFIGDASIPIILMFLGSNLADTSKDAHVPKRITFSVVFVRLVLLPAIGITTVYFLIKMHFLPDDIILQMLIMIQFAMPSAVNLILACQVAGGGEAKMSSLLFWQYVVCSVTISLFCILVQFILL